MLKLDSLYIYIGGVSPPPPPTATNHRSCLPRRVGAARPRALRPRLTPAPCARALRPRLAPAPYARALRPRGLRSRPTPARPKPARLTPRALRHALYATRHVPSHQHAGQPHARTSARKRTTPRERNWSPAPPRRASGQLPHCRTSQPTRQKCSDHSSLGVLWFLFTRMRSTKRHARRVFASHRREETAAPTHGTALGACTTPSVWGRVEG